MQVLRGQFWQPMGEHGELCGWQPHVPVNMLVDALVVTPVDQHPGRHGSLAAACLQALVLSVVDGMATGGAPARCTACTKAANDAHHLRTSARTSQ